MSAQVLRRFGPTIQNDENKGTIIRFPATANFLVDSEDRLSYPATASSPSTNFIINKNNSLFNGFFTRFALTEMVLDWCVDNIAPGNDTFSVTGPAPTGTTTITLDAGSYTAADVLDSIVAQLNTAIGPATFRLEDKFGNVYNPATSVGPVYLATTGGANFTINDTLLASKYLNLASQIGVPGAAFPITCPKLIPYAYIDFVSPQLTYNQELKDNSTQISSRDVLFRWNFAWDQESSYDKYGYPVFQGYKPFIARRAVAFPKQIAWTPDIPVGQVAFQVYDENGDLLDIAGMGEMEFQMTFLVSEN